MTRPTFATAALFLAIWLLNGTAVAQSNSANENNPSTTPSDPGERIKNGATDVGQGIKEGAQMVGQKVKDAAVNTWEAGKAAVQAGSSKLKEGQAADQQK